MGGGPRWALGGAGSRGLFWPLAGVLHAALGDAERVSTVSFYAHLHHAGLLVETYMHYLPKI